MYTQDEQTRLLRQQHWLELKWFRGYNGINFKHFEVFDFAISIKYICIFINIISWIHIIVEPHHHSLLFMTLLYIIVLFNKQ